MKGYAIKANFVFEDESDERNGVWYFEKERYAGTQYEDFDRDLDKAFIYSRKDEMLLTRNKKGKFIYFTEDFYLGDHGHIEDDEVFKLSMEFIEVERITREV